MDWERAENMNSTTRLTRDSDSKEFRPIDIAHWCKIGSFDGEEDLVKWVGANYYVGSQSGAGYHEVDNQESVNE